ncbi:anthranilate phosphoribosyltransferase [Fastidiosibacter lacustris]|uniref:anthranilate phosphoribosyltransferase n=1 Tax=Fastidiosibacter lacustris TaxID=2056695 RepID=UPI0013004764|nr:anthranilate phosphoribosyltransferase [Fastidiosibacter lacustris]
MNVSELVKTLVNDDTSEDQQYEIIKQIDKEVYQEQTLFSLVQAFLEYSIAIENPFLDTLDIVGTGGDGCRTLNYSTLSAFVVHKLGAKLAKHGNRSTTSKCGSFDLLHKLNIKLPQTADEAFRLLQQTGIVFLFAPFFHPIFAKVSNVRKRFAEQGKRTFFNVLGPLLNPMRVKRIVVGVYDERLLKPYLYALKNQGVTHAYIVYGDGMDEFSVCGVNKVIQIHNDTITEFSLHPEQVGFMRSKLEYLEVGNLYQNLEESKALFNNEILGVKQDTLVINAAAARHVACGFEGMLIDHVKVIKDALQKGVFAKLI